jgi:hypothetical protein
MFHATFGYYAQGVEAATAVLPLGWEERLVRFQTAGTRGVIAWCLEPHDLRISKMIAGRPKDLEFGRALLENGTVEPAELMKRLEEVHVDEPIQKRISAKIGAWGTPGAAFSEPGKSRRIQRRNRTRLAGGDVSF